MKSEQTPQQVSGPCTLPRAAGPSESGCGAGAHAGNGFWSLRPLARAGAPGPGRRGLVPERTLESGAQLLGSGGQAQVGAVRRRRWEADAPALLAIPPPRARPGRGPRHAHRRPRTLSTRERRRAGRARMPAARGCRHGHSSAQAWPTTCLVVGGNAPGPSPRPTVGPGHRDLSGRGDRQPPSPSPGTAGRLGGPCPTPPRGRPFGHQAGCALPVRSVTNPDAGTHECPRMPPMAERSTVSAQPATAPGIRCR